MKACLLLLFLLFGTWNLYSQDTLIAYFIYGSKPAASNENKWFGGKLGGHVGLGVSADSIYHFNPGGKVKAFGSKSPKGRWNRSTEADFLCTFGCDSNKILKIYIPVTHEKWLEVIETGEYFLANSPYPYAFFGMRCTAACYHLLSVASITETASKSRMIRKNFYPRKLRKRLLKQAKENNWKTVLTEGRTSRKWDHD